MYILRRILPAWIILTVSLHSVSADAPASPGLALGDASSGSVEAAGAAPPSRSVTFLCHDIPCVDQACAAVRQISAPERMLAPQKNPRIVTLRREEQQRKAQYGMEMWLARWKVANQRRINKLKPEKFQQHNTLELELLVLELQTKERKVANLN